MKKFITSLFLLFSVVSFSKVKSVLVESHPIPKSPIIIQGPMPIEAENLAAKLDNVTIEKSGNYVFYKGTLDNYPVIVTKTSKGMENTAAATALAIERYKPIAVINQGTSGGHDKSLNVGDIVLGKRTFNAGNFKTTSRLENEGVTPFEWVPMDVMASEGSAGESSDAEKVRYYEGNPLIIEAALKVKDEYKRGKVVEGTVASANFWNNEIDRINWLHEEFGSSVEEMEGASAALICEAYKIPFLSIRVLSNNKTNGGKYDPSVAKDCQDFVEKVVKQYIKMINK